MPSCHGITNSLLAYMTMNPESIVRVSEKNISEWNPRQVWCNLWRVRSGLGKVPTCHTYWKTQILPWNEGRVRALPYRACLVLYPELLGHLQRLSMSMWRYSKAPFQNSRIKIPQGKLNTLNQSVFGFQKLYISHSLHPQKFRAPVKNLNPMLVKLLFMYFLLSVYVDSLSR